VLAVVSITIINSALVAIIEKLTDFEKHHTRSKMARSLAKQLFLTQVTGDSVWAMKWGQYYGRMAGLAG
jgi:hypothetical protein